MTTASRFHPSSRPAASGNCLLRCHRKNDNVRAQYSLLFDDTRQTTNNPAMNSASSITSPAVTVGANCYFYPPHVGHEMLLFSRPTLGNKCYCFPPHVGHKMLLFSTPRWARNVTFLPAARWATNITFFQHRVGHQIKRISCPTLASTEACLYPSAALPASLQSV